MTRPLRIVVADDEPDMRDYFQKILPRLGHQVVAAAADGRQLVDFCRVFQPDLVITDIQMPELDGIDAALEICRHCPVPIILVSAFHDPDLVARAETTHVLGYLVKPIKQVDLAPAIALAMRRFGEFQELRQEVAAHFQAAAQMFEALEGRRVIERAREVLAQREMVAESEAQRRLERLAHERGQDLRSIAQEVLDDAPTLTAPKGASPPSE
jgi:response regulator NasT